MSRGLPTEISGAFGGAGGGAAGDSPSAALIAGESKMIDDGLASEVPQGTTSTLTPRSARRPFAIAGTLPRGGEAGTSIMPDIQRLGTAAASG